MIVKGGEATCGKVSANIRVVRLPAPIVALADKGAGHGVKQPRLLAADALIEVAWILFEERRQHGSPDEGAGGNVCVGRPEAFRVTLGALPQFAVFICRLLDSGHYSNP